MSRNSSLSLKANYFPPEPLFVGFFFFYFNRPMVLSKLEALTVVKASAGQGI